MFWSLNINKVSRIFHDFFKSKIHLLMQLSKRHLVDKTVLKSIKIEHYLLYGNCQVRNGHMEYGAEHDAHDENDAG